jgi:hypothetical protein
MQVGWFRVLANWITVDLRGWWRGVQTQVVVGKPTGKLQLGSGRGERPHRTEQVQLLVG